VPLSDEDRKRKACERSKLWAKNNPDKVKANRKRYLATEKGRATTAKYAAEHIEDNRKSSRESMKRRRAKDPARARAIEKQWRTDNPEKAHAKAARSLKKWRAANPEKARTAARRQRAANPEARRAAEKRWRDANPFKVAAKFARRKALHARASGSFTDEQAAARVAFYGGICAYCRTRPHEHLDHVIPLSKGGTNWPANIRPACEWCNSSKGNKPLAVWRASLTR
jgi:5-methylcytosine-specific restriction endonuclease McrA